jgi:O-antigen/teichoic acid export membrane protein
MEQKEPQNLDVRWGLPMVVLDNLSRPFEALLILACASIYAGGAWGSFRFAESFAYLLFRLSLLGLDRGIVWWHGRTDTQQYRRDLGSSIWLIAGTSILGGAAFLFLAGTAIGRVRGLELSRADNWCIASSIPLLAIADFLYQANLNRKEMLARIVGNNFAIPLFMFGGALLSRWLGLSWRLPACFLCGNAANAVVAVWAFLDRHGQEHLTVLPGRPSRQLLSYGMPILGSDLLSGVVARFDLVLLGRISGIRAVEVYNLVMTLGKSLQAIRQSFEGLLLAAFSRVGANRLTPLLRLRFNYSAWAVGNLLGFAFLMVVFWGKDFLTFLAPEYRDGYFSLVVLTSFTYLNVHGDLSGLMLQGLGRSRTWGVAQLAGFAVNIACNMWWIPMWGTFGGVLALGVSFLVQGVLCQIFLSRLAGEVGLWRLDYLRSSAGFALLLAAASVASVWMVGSWIRIPSFFLIGSIWFALYRSGSLEFRENMDAPETLSGEIVQA